MLTSEIGQWTRVDDLNRKGVRKESTIKWHSIDEFHEWLDIDNKDELEIVTLDEINEDEYNDFVDYMNDNSAWRSSRLILY